MNTPSITILHCELITMNYNTVTTFDREIEQKKRQMNSRTALYDTRLLGHVLATCSTTR